jgi:rubrerythrin
MPDFGNPFGGNSLDRKLTKEELIRALRFSIAAEYEAVQLYIQLAEASPDETAEKVLRDIAEEEIVHAGEFLAVLKKLSPDEQKLYNKGEKEVRDMTGVEKYAAALRGITALKTARELDKIAGELEEPDPKTALILDRLSDRIEKTHRILWRQS